MSGGFKDTFTKDETKEGQLNYDDRAFYYFASSVLFCIAIPWTLSFLYNIFFPGKRAIEQDFPAKNKEGNKFRYCTSSQMIEKVEKARREVGRCGAGGTKGLVTRVFFLSLIWCAILYMTHQLSQGGTEMARWNPFEILEVEPGADDKTIKKGYRKLSLIYHPDKNPNDPLASSKFIQITKAYNALTDEVAKKNFEKYGNPDGPTTTKVGIGLPRFLLEKDNHLMILCVFFALLIIVIPTVFICYYQKTKNYAANGVMIETLQFMGYYMNEATRIKNCPELLAASAESRFMKTRPGDDFEMKAIIENVVEHKKRQFTMPIIIKNQLLMWAHMQRLPLTENLQGDVDELLKHSVKITQAMIEIGCMREWFFTAQSMIEFRRCLIQALDVKSSQLLQIPHFTEATLKHCHRGKNAVSGLNEFLKKDSEERKGLANMDAQQLLDIEAFNAHISEIELKAVLEVEDEAEIVVGDVATVNIQITRKNLKEGEAMGPVHAPFFPEPKFEEWWVFLVEGTKIIAHERIRDTERVVEEKLRFQVGRPGKHEFVLHALCDSYAGIDAMKKLNFTAMTDEEVKREVFVHEEDEKLDEQPTLFQQFMGELNHDEESEEEEELKSRSKVKSQAKSLGDESKAKDADDSDSDSDSDDDDDDKKKKDKDDSSSSDSD